MKHVSIKGATVTMMAAALCLVLLAGASVAVAQAPAEWDGLARVSSKRVEFLYVRPGVSLAGYKRVRLDPVDVAFDKNWDPNPGTRSLSQKLSKADLEAIKTDLAAEFRKVFSGELAKGGYVLTNENGEDVLRVTARIMDLYINAPNKPTAGPSRTYATGAGRMTLAVELRDSVTGQVLARAVDRQKASGMGNFQVSSRVGNSAEARAIITKWADVLRDGLDDANDKPEGK